MSGPPARWTAAVADKDINSIKGRCSELHEIDRTLPTSDISNDADGGDPHRVNFR
jgi:hypothetical protein